MSKEKIEICIGRRSGKTYNKIQEMAKEIDRLQKELEQEKEKNFKRSDMIFQLKSNNTYLKDRVTALENADLKTIYSNGFYKGEKKWQDKIKYKIKYNKVFNDDISKYAVITLEDLLKENNNE